MLEAQSTKPAMTSIDITKLPTWARTIDWVDALDTHVCAFGLVIGNMIEVASRTWRVEWVGRWK